MRPKYVSLYLVQRADLYLVQRADYSLLNGVHHRHIVLCSTLNGLVNNLDKRLCTLSKKSPWTLKKVPFSQKMHYIRQIKSVLCEAGECPLYFDTKLEGIH